MSVELTLKDARTLLQHESHQTEVADVLRSCLLHVSMGKDDGGPEVGDLRKRVAFSVARSQLVQEVEQSMKHLTHVRPILRRSTSRRARKAHTMIRGGVQEARKQSCLGKKSTAVFQDERK